MISINISGFKKEGSFGIAQWNPANAAGNRLQKFQQWATSQGLNWTLLYPQLKYIVYELENFSYLGLNAVRKSNSVEDASKEFEKRFERPAAGSTIDRINFSLEMYNKYGPGAVVVA